MKTTMLTSLLSLALCGSALGAEPQWAIEGKAMTMDNCVVGCPCIFGEQPTHGRCRYLGVMVIERGTYGTVRLDNTRLAMAGAFGRPRERAEQQYDFVAYYIDATASASQKEALKAIVASPAFAGFGAPVEVKEVPIAVTDLAGFGQVGQTYGATLGEIGRLEVTPVGGAMAGEPIVVENSAEGFWHWTALGKTSASYYKSAGVDWTFDGTSGESHRFSLRSAAAAGSGGHH